MSRERRPTIVRRGSSRVARDIAADRFSFTERTPLEHGFARIFHDKIVPILRRQEKSRQVMRRKALTGIGLTGLAGAGGGAAGFLQDWGGATFIAPFLGVAGGIGSYGYYQAKWASALSSEVIPVMCDFLGDMTYGGPTVAPGEFEDLGVVPDHSSASLEDTVTGNHGGLAYTLTEAKLTRRSSGRKGRTRKRTVFKGLMIRIELAEEAPEIIFARDRGGLVNRLSETLSPTRRGREKVATHSTGFEEHYEVYATDAAAARRFITPRLTNGLLEIAKGETGRERYVAAATRGRGFYLAIPRSDDFLGLGSLFRPLNVAEDDFHQCLADLDLPRRVIDALRGR